MPEPCSRGTPSRTPPGPPSLTVRARMPGLVSWKASWHRWRCAFVLHSFVCLSVCLCITLCMRRQKIKSELRCENVVSVQLCMCLCEFMHMCLQVCHLSDASEAAHGSVYRAASMPMFVKRAVQSVYMSVRCTLCRPAGDIVLWHVRSASNRHTFGCEHQQGNAPVCIHVSFSLGVCC